MKNTQYIQLEEALKNHELKQQASENRINSETNNKIAALVDNFNIFRANIDEVIKECYKTVNDIRAEYKLFIGNVTPEALGRHTQAIQEALEATQVTLEELSRKSNITKSEVAEVQESVDQASQECNTIVESMKVVMTNVENCKKALELIGRDDNLKKFEAIEKTLNNTLNNKITSMKKNLSKQMIK